MRARNHGPPAPPEVVPALDTVWVGGAVDRVRCDERQRVLVLDTGDPYHF
ncbi:hypothetical protein PV963_26380 [Streptomyces coeruleorubidus]|nr:hypothetical protein [Streptomyces coeruleorubidus]WDV57085.1 hypothetical protein PV963_26380 [Streptomyces coeruleorubidus]